MTTITALTPRAGRTWRFAGALVLAALTLFALWASANGADAATSVTGSVKKRVLKITGTTGADAITLRLQAGNPNILEVDAGADGTADLAFDRQRFGTIVVDGLAGRDMLVADHSNGLFTDTESTTFNGGDGDDVLIGSFGPETLNAGRGDDFVDGGGSSDTVAGGDGEDVFQWDPGDGSDVLVGGVGTDRLAFNGANVGELFDVSNVGGHVRFTRNVASIVMDLDDVEAIDLRTLGGSDVVNVNDLTGTDLATFTTDLAGAGGGDDFVADSVVVPAGVTIGRDGSVATVDGLGAQVRVVNGWPLDEIHVTGPGVADVVHVAGTSGADAVNVYASGTDVVVDGATPGVFVRLTTVETVDVDLFGGADQFAAVGNLAALTSLDVDGGDGADTLLGGNGADVIFGGADADFIDGNMGADTASGGDGDDVFQWDPGDASDVLVGGAGADRLQFNGSNIGELLDVSNVGGHVRLTRNIAVITMDLDEIEAIDLRTFGGNDVVTVNDLTGTDLATFTPDLHGVFGGGDDFLADSVVVPAGVTVGRDGSVATVDGLGAQVRVVNGWPLDEIRVPGSGVADVVHIAGTSGADAVSVFASGTDVVVDGATPGVFVRLTTVELVDVDLFGGADQFAAAGNLAALTSLDVDGGDGADTLLGGNGADVIFGGADADFIDGNMGADTASGGDGADVFQWDPGDASDVLVGGAGADRLVFNGSGASELYDLSAVSDHVRLTRNIAVITMDLDEIEAIDLRTLGGTDVVNVNDLTGTDLATFTTDLHGVFGGGDDFVADSVVVPAGVTIGRDGSAATVDGLGAQVRVVNGWPLDEIHVTGPGVADVVHIAGTSGADTVNAFASGTDAVVDGATPGVFVRLTSVETVDVDLFGGADQFAAVGNLAALTSLDVDGGDGADTLLGGNGADVIAGGPDADFIDGNQGTDTASGGDGDDVFQWDPGDGNDVLVGDAGADRLQFNGSNIGELLDVSNVGGHVRLTRNIAVITMDLDEIEAIDLRTFGGNDVVTVNDLTGTDLTTFTADLAAVFGGTSGDALSDEVIVNGTAGDDTIAVTDQGTDVVAQGLAATVRVKHADPTLDRLTVNGLAGNDTITPTPGAAALMLLNLVP